MGMQDTNLRRTLNPNEVGNQLNTFRQMENSSEASPMSASSLGTASSPLGFYCFFPESPPYYVVYESTRGAHISDTIATSST